MQSAKCKVQSAECGVRTGKQSVECKIACGVQSVNYKAWRAKSKV